MDGRVDERLHDQEHVRRAGAADGGRHGHELLVLDLELGAQAAGAAPRSASRWTRRDLWRGVPDGHAPAQLRGRVGHARARSRRGAARWRERRSSAPAMTLMTSWLRRSTAPARAPTRLSIWGLMPRTTMSAPSTASVFDSVVRMPWLGSSSARRSARGWLATIARASTWRAEQAGDHRLGHHPGAHGRDGDVVAVTRAASIGARSAGPGAIIGADAHHPTLGDLDLAARRRPTRAPGTGHACRARRVGRRAPSGRGLVLVVGQRPGARRHRRVRRGVPRARRGLGQLRGHRRVPGTARNGSPRRASAPTRAPMSTASCAASSTCASARSCPWTPP